MSTLRAGVTLALTALAVSVPATASAEPDRIELSLDGSSWASTLAGPLFGEAPVLVPLDSVTGSFYVRNGSSVPAAASLEVVPSAVPSELDEHLKVTWTLGDIESTATVGKIVRGRCSTTVTGPTLLPDEWQRVDVVLALPDLDGRTAQGSSTDLSLQVRLTQVLPPGAVTVCDEEVGGPPPAAPPVRPPVSPPATPPVVTPPGPPAVVDPCAGTEVVLVGNGRDDCGAEAPGRPGVGRPAPEVAGVSGGRPAAGTAGASTGLLPGTGSPGGLTEAALFGAGCVGLGALLMAVRRRGARSSD